MAKKNRSMSPAPVSTPLPPPCHPHPHLCACPVPRFSRCTSCHRGGGSVHDSRSSACRRRRRRRRRRLRLRPRWSAPSPACPPSPPFHPHMLAPLPIFPGTHPGLRGVKVSSRGFDFLLKPLRRSFLSPGSFPRSRHLPRLLRQHLPRCTTFAHHIFSSPASPLTPSPLHSSYQSIQQGPPSTPRTNQYNKEGCYSCVILAGLVCGQSCTVF